MNEMDVYEGAKRIVVFAGFGIILALGVSEFSKFVCFLHDVAKDRLLPRIKRLISR